MSRCVCTLITLERSLANNKKITGAITDPWGIPLLTFFSCNSASTSYALWVLPVLQDLIYQTTVSYRLKNARFANKNLWLTCSNALAKFKYATLAPLSTSANRVTVRCSNWKLKRQNRRGRKFKPTLNKPFLFRLVCTWNIRTRPRFCDCFKAQP